MPRTRAALPARYLLRPVDRGELDEVFYADETVPVPVQGVEHSAEARTILRGGCGISGERRIQVRVRGRLVTCQQSFAHPTRRPGGQAAPAGHAVFGLRGPRLR